MKRKTVNKAIVLSTAAAMAAGSTTIGVLADSVTATSVKKDTIKDQTAVNILKPKSGYTYLSSVASAAKQDNIVTVAYENGEKAQITFLENNLFRFDMEPDGKSDSFKDYATPNNSEETGRIIQQKDDSSEYNKPSPTVEETDGYITISTDSVRLEIDKATSMMKLLNAKTKEVIWEESAPIQYKSGSTIQTLKKQGNENFYGGGTQNGRFVHTGQAINIVNENGWTDGKVSSPNPFYWSTNGYGVVRNTFKPGKYDFGNTTEGKVTTTHNENRFDAYFFVGDKPTDILNSYFKLTGDPALMPMKSFYLGHLNCYNRDEWKAASGNSGSLLEDGKRYQEKNNAGVAEPGWTLETLNGKSDKNDSAYKFSARAVIDGHVSNDMPFGWFIPNDGYGCGYGQSDTSLDDNIANLKNFTQYAAQYGIGTGLWTQSDLTPNPKEPIHLQRDFEKEVKEGGIRTLKTDVAWVGQGYSFGLNGISHAYDIVAETKDRPTIVTLDGWAGTQRYGGIWTGDQTGGNWEYIRFHIPTYIGQSLSGNPNVSSDVDGIFGGSSLIQTRDIQWKSFTTMMLDMDGWGSFPKKPYIFGEDTTSINRMYLKLRAELMPYIYSTAYTSANLGEGSEKGKPQVRAMFLEYPDDPNTYGTNVQYQFMMGQNLLVAPIYQDTAMKDNGDDIRNGIYLPDEDQVWIDYFTGKQYRGNQTLNNFDAPIWKLPLFVKNGAILPMFTENNNAEPISDTNTKGLDKSKRIVEFYPDATKKSTNYTLYEDDGKSIDNTNKDQPTYGDVVTTHFTSKVDNGTATLTAEKSTGSYGGYNANRETTFVVNVSKEPSDITAKVGDQTLNKADFTVVTSQEEFDKAKGNTYFYNAKPNLNKYATADSDFASKEITTTPKLYVKFAKMNVNNKAVQLQVKDFVNDGKLNKYELNKNLGVPQNLTVDEDNVTPTSIPLTWSAVSGATGYEVETDGVIQGGIASTSYTHEDLEYHSKHTYRIRAINEDGFSAWSAPLEAQSALDPYRNVPKDIELKWPYGDQWGAVKNALDFDYGNMFHSTDNAINKDFIMDMKKVYDMDRFEYTPRQDNKGNGAVQQMDIYASIDGTDYSLVHEGVQDEWTYSNDMSVRDTKTVDLKGVRARYLKLVPRKSKGGFFSAAEMQPYKIDGTEGILPGDTNKDGVVDDNDLTQIDNYVGLEKGDAAWGQVKDMDWNNNGYIDALDVAYTTTQLNGGIAKPAGIPEGNIQFVADKADVKKGEKLSIKAYGINMKNVYALGFQLPFNSSDLNYITTKPSLATINMKQFAFSRKKVEKEADSVNDFNLNVVFSDIGNQTMISGTQDLCTFEFIAMKDMNITDAFYSEAKVTYVSSGLKEINPLKTPQDPSLPNTERILTENEVPSVTFSNDVNNNVPATNLWQQDDWKKILFDGNLSNNAEFKYYYGSASDLTPDVKLPTDMKFTFDKARGITSFKVYNRESGNGRMTSIKAVAHTEAGQKVDLGTISEAKNIYEFNIPKDAGKITSITITPLTSNGQAIANNDPNTVPEGGKENRMLTLHEIQFIEDSTQNVKDIVLDKNNPTQINVNRIVDFKASVTPGNASNPFYEVTSSDPSVISIIKTITPDGYAFALKGNKAGTADITVSSQGVNDAGKKVMKRVSITVVDGVYLDDLQKMLQDAKDTIAEEQLYTKESLTKLQDAIANAEKAMADKKSQSAVDNTVIDLHNAMVKLEYKGSDELQPDSQALIPHTTIKPTATSSAGESPVTNLIDGQQNTFWHSDYSGANRLPQAVTLDLGGNYAIEQLDYLPRQDGSKNGDITEYRIEISEDGQNYKPVVQGSFAHNDTELLQKDSFNKVKFQRTMGRYVKFIALSGLGDIPNAYASAAEIQVYGIEVSDLKPATGIQLDVTELKDMETGMSQQIHAALTPADSTDLLTWTSSNEKVAIVDGSGLVTAVGSGTATVTVQANENVKAEISVSVRAEDKDLLTSLIQEAKTQAEGYDNADIEKYLQDAITEAETHLNGDKDEIKAAYQALAAAMSEADLIDQDVTAIKAYAAVDLSKYEAGAAAETYKSLVQDSLALAKDPVQNKDALAAAKKQLDEVYGNLVALHLDRLQEAVVYAEKLNMDNYVDNAERKAFIGALHEAKTLQPKTNQQIMETIDRLSNAMKALTRRASKEQIATIKKQFDVLSKLDKSQYSKADQKKIADVLAAAKTAMENKNLSEADAEKVIEQLNSLLTLKPIAPQKPDDGTEKPDGQTKPDQPAVPGGTPQKPVGQDKEPVIANPSTPVDTSDSTNNAGWLAIIGLGGAAAWFTNKKRTKLKK